MTAKQLEQETGCKIMVRGKGSMRDKKKVSDIEFIQLVCVFVNLTGGICLETKMMLEREKKGGYKDDLFGFLGDLLACVRFKSDTGLY